MPEGVTRGKGPRPARKRKGWGRVPCGRTPEGMRKAEGPRRACAKKEYIWL